MINLSTGKGNSIDEYYDNLNILKSNGFVTVYFVICKWPVYYI
jgi:hypothetical protein